MNIIAFGQQPNGIFPKNYLFAKIQTAKNLQQKIGGKLIFIYHDSDADYRETITPLIDLTTKAEVRLNFLQENKIQKNFSPLYLKRIPKGWKEDIIKQLPRFFLGDEAKKIIKLFESVNAQNAADFCLEMYQKLGLLDDIEIVRSSDKTFREAADEIKEDIYADVPFENEVVRARLISPPTQPSTLNPEPYQAQLHHGGGKFTTFDIAGPLGKSQLSAGRDERFAWMNSVIKCTHYVSGNSEFEYLKRDQFPVVEFLKRDQVDQEGLAWLPT